MSEFKSGYVGIVGRPNVGKSTILNALLGQKIAIISAKPQTTRSKILAIMSDSDSQVVFLDTPGFHTPKNKKCPRRPKPTRVCSLFIFKVGEKFFLPLVIEFGCEGAVHHVQLLGDLKQRHAVDVFHL